MNAIDETIKFLDVMADNLDRWAKESIEGSWSTHQVTKNMEAANACRLQAAELRKMRDKIDSRPAHCPGCDGDHI